MSTSLLPTFPDFFPNGNYSFGENRISGSLCIVLCLMKRWKDISVSTHLLMKVWNRRKPCVPASPFSVLSAHPNVKGYKYF